MRINFEIVSDRIFKLIRMLPHSRYYQKKYRTRPRVLLRNVNTDISIIATNCVGGEIYHILGRKFNTPFINNFMEREKFVEMAYRFDDYIRAPFRIENAENGVGLKLILTPKDLPEIDIKFPHDNNHEVLRNNWEKRLKRINFDKLVFICDDRGLNQYYYELYDRVKAYKKIMLTSKDIGYEWATILSSYAGKPFVGHYNYKDFIKGIWNFEKEWDYGKFLS